MGNSCCRKTVIEEESRTEANKPPSLSTLIARINNSPTAVHSQDSSAPEPKLPLSNSKPTQHESVPKFQRGDFIQVLHGEVSQYYRALNTLGSGTYGSVIKAVNKTSGAYRAVKLLQKANLTPQQQAKLMCEVEVLKSLDHPNIINIFEVIENSKSLNIVTELCTGGELFGRIVDSGHLTENKAATYMHQIISGVICCHKAGVVHRDLKPENIVFLDNTADSPLKLIDFGTSRKLEPDRHLSSLTGTAYYIAPEVLEGNYNAKCDIWSCGVILFIMLCGYPPFIGEDDSSIFYKVSQAKFSFSGREWSKVSSGAKALVMRMLTKDPESRPSAEQVLQDSWLQLCSQNLVKDNVLDKATLKNLSGFRATRVLQQAILGFIVAQLTTAQETEELRKVFVALDKDGDGKLSVEELHSAYNGAGMTLINVQEVLKTCDADQSGFIEYTEFLTATINWKKVLNQEKLHIAFKSFDIDGSGAISVNELRAAFGASAGDWSELFEEADTNGDGEIDLEEFKNLMIQKF